MIKNLKVAQMQVTYKITPTTTCLLVPFLDPTGSLELTLSVSAVSQCSFLIVENPSVKQIKLTDGIYTSSKSIYHFLT